MSTPSPGKKRFFPDSATGRPVSVINGISFDYIMFQVAGQFDPAWRRQRRMLFHDGKQFGGRRNFIAPDQFATAQSAQQSAVLFLQFAFFRR